MLKFISLLGNTKYTPCRYYLDSPDGSTDICWYVQFALLELLEKKGIVPDQVVVFTTENAYEKNWIRNHAKEDAENASGLYALLQEYSDRTGAVINNVMIPDGKSEDEIWQIFNKIFEQIGEDDEIILDITHSFRFLPMLTFIVLNYARFMKHCSIRDVYYGLVPQKEGEHTPILVLTPFVTLFDWTIGLERYLSAGDASWVHELTYSEASRMNKEINRSESSVRASDRSLLFRDPKLLRKLADAMLEFSNIMWTCRGQEITKAAAALKANIDIVLESAAHERIKPLSPLVELLRERFSRFSTQDEVRNMIEAARWCLEHRMYQQGFTILQEGLITLGCKNAGISVLDEEIRMSLRDREDVVSRHGALVKLIDSMCDTRNDINHAGWRPNPRRVSVFQKNLAKFISDAEQILRLAVEGCEGGEAKHLKPVMLLLLSHALTDKQRRDAQQEFGISQFISMPEELSQKWATIPPELDNLSDYLMPFKEWIHQYAGPGDYALIQGDYGATFELVEYCRMRGITAVYATTTRKAVEQVNGDKVTITRQFEHVRFRRYC